MEDNSKKTTIVCECKEIDEDGNVLRTFPMTSTEKLKRIRRGVSEWNEQLKTVTALMKNVLAGEKAESGLQLKIAGILKEKGLIDNPTKENVQNALLEARSEEKTSPKRSSNSNSNKTSSKNSKTPTPNESTVPTPATITAPKESNSSPKSNSPQNVSSISPRIELEEVEGEQTVIPIRNLSNSKSRKMQRQGGGGCGCTGGAEMMMKGGAGCGMLPVMGGRRRGTRKSKQSRKARKSRKNKTTRRRK